MSSSINVVRTALIIDDDHVDQMIYKRIFSRSDKVQNLISFTDAKKALEYLESEECEQIDVIFLDIYMPKMNGFAFLDALEQQLGNKNSAAIIIMLSTSKDVDDVERAKKYEQVKAYVNKPITVEDVEEIIENVVLKKAA